MQVSVSKRGNMIRGPRPSLTPRQTPRSQMPRGIVQRHVLPNLWVSLLDGTHCTMTKMTDFVVPCTSHQATRRNPQQVTHETCTNDVSWFLHTPAAGRLCRPHCPTKSPAILTPISTSSNIYDEAYSEPKPQLSPVPES